MWVYYKLPGRFLPILALSRIPMFKSSSLRAPVLSFELSIETAPSSTMAIIITTHAVFRQFPARKCESFLVL